MTYGQDDRSDQYPHPGYGQQYRPEDQPWPPHYDLREHQRGTSSAQGAPWQPAPYPPQDYPPGDQRQPSQHHRERSRAPLYAGIAAVIVIAGGGAAYALAGHGGGSPRHVSSSSPAATATPASRSQLEKIVLQPADLPQGWKGTPHQADPNASADDAAMNKCLGVRNTDSDQVAEADSKDFTLGHTRISSSATSYRSQSDLVAGVAMLHSPKLSACFEQLLTKQIAATLPAGGTVQSVSVKVTPGSSGGPASIVATLAGTIKVQVNGQEIPAYMTVAFITAPLIEAEVDALSIGAPVPGSVVWTLFDTVAARASNG